MPSSGPPLPQTHGARLTARDPDLRDAGDGSRIRSAGKKVPPRRQDCQGWPFRVLVAGFISIIAESSAGIAGGVKSRDPRTSSPSGAGPMGGAKYRRYGRMECVPVLFAVLVVSSRPGAEDL